MATSGSALTGGSKLCFGLSRAGEELASAFLKNKDPRSWQEFVARLLELSLRGLVTSSPAVIKALATSSTTDQTSGAHAKWAEQPRKASEFRWRASSPSGERAFVDPVDIKSALGEKPYAVDLHESVEVTERRNHQAPLPTVDRHVMR